MNSKGIKDRLGNGLLSYKQINFSTEMSLQISQVSQEFFIQRNIKPVDITELAIRFLIVLFIGFYLLKKTLFIIAPAYICVWLVSIPGFFFGLEGMYNIFVTYVKLFFNLFLAIIFLYFFDRTYLE